jgi:hypothetical protein
MSRSTLRRIRRLRADAEPVIAELGRRTSDLMRSAPILAEDHLLRVIGVFRYGEPRIEEPLARAYGRALSKLRVDEQLLPNHLRGILEREPPAGDIKSKIAAGVRQTPDWLQHLCFTGVSMKLIGFEPTQVAQDLLKLQPTRSDRDCWPWLPQGILVPLRDLGEEVRQRARFFDALSVDELYTFLRIWNTPERERTRHERRLLGEMMDREPSKRVIDDHD